MSAQKDRTKRPVDAPAIPLYVRVDPSIREAVSDAAAAAGVSMSYYVDAMLKNLLDAHGSLPGIESPRPQREELPITFAA